MVEPLKQMTLVNKFNWTNIENLPNSKNRMFFDQDYDQLNSQPAEFSFDVISDLESFQQTS